MTKLFRQLIFITLNLLSFAWRAKLLDMLRCLSKLNLLKNKSMPIKFSIAVIFLLLSTAPIYSQDADFDGILDFIDLDDDNDGILDVNEMGVCGIADWTTNGYTSGTTDYQPSILSAGTVSTCLLYTSPSPRDRTRSRMPSSA